MKIIRNNLYYNPRFLKFKSRRISRDTFISLMAVVFTYIIVFIFVLLNYQDFVDPRQFYPILCLPK